MKKNVIMILLICALTLTLAACKTAAGSIAIEGDPAVEELSPETEVIIEPEITGPVVTAPQNAEKISEELEVLSLVSLNVRETPDTSGKVLGTLNKNATVPYISTDNSWHKVLYKNKTAYVSAKSDYSRLKLISEEADVVEKIIEVGMSVLGTPYQFGSTRIIDYNFKRISSFTGNTFDCSAFVQYCFYAGGDIKLYGDSRSMSKQGVTVKMENLKRGDVVFMTSTDRQYNTGIERIGHVAIYLGDNKLLHTYGTGGVRITDFNSFWRGRFITAKDMIV